MSEKTVEERAQIAIDGMFDLSTIQFSIADQIRAAVDEQREKDAKIAKMKCRTSHIWTLFDDGEADKAGEEIATAIRAGGTEPEEKVETVKLDPQMIADLMEEGRKLRDEICEKFDRPIDPKWWNIILRGAEKKERGPDDED